MTVELLTLTSDPAAGDTGSGTAAMLARLFTRQGVVVRGQRWVSLAEEEVDRALRQAVEGGGLVVCLGDGEGGDAARHALARLLGARLVLSDNALDALAAAYARQGRAMPRRAEALALVPRGATVLVTAPGEPGLLAEAGLTLIALLPADAGTATALATEHLLPRVAPQGGGPVTLVRTLRLVGLDLAEAWARLDGLLRGVTTMSAHPVEVAGEVWVRLALREATATAAGQRFRELTPALRDALGPAWYGTDDERLEAVVGRLLHERGLTVALAESCTGGLIAHRLTDISGSSRYFERGLVVYSNAAKQALLGVPEALLARHGAVSAECAEAMARGVRDHAGTDLGLSVTGIAGPEGGSAAKPVGTVFIGLADARAATVERHRFPRDREGNKALSALRGLDLLRRYCLAR
jgi:nicotinamide-nucleotide amidase